jgi:TPR repeat protein
MKTLIHAAIAALLLRAIAALAAEAVPPKANPFDQAAQASFAGRFQGPDVQMRLKPEGAAWTGTILFKGQSYTVQAALRSGMLEGTFGDGQQTWPFSISGEGDNLSFTAGSFKAALQRQASPAVQGVYKSPRVELEFLNEDGGTNGLLTFKGEKFQFTASEVAGDLEGAFQNGAQTFQFSLAPENKGWVFKTGQFSDVLSLPDRPADDFRAAAARGEANAQFNLGWCFANGCGVARDYAEAARWYRKAAEQGDAAAENGLGVCYYKGQGVAKDFSEAANWYRKAAEQGNVYGQGNLGICYDNGRGVVKDSSEAVKWFRKAAEQGNGTSQRNLGICYYKGQGVAKDFSEAANWYRKAAEQGDAVAENDLGVCYYKGQGVVKDSSEAVKWFRKAAEQGNVHGQRNLGICYYNGCSFCNYSQLIHSQQVMNVFGQYCSH